MSEEFKPTIQSTHRAMRKRVKTSKMIKKEIFYRDCYTCQYCGEKATVIDHIIPYSYGGSDSEKNLLASCLLCNLLASNCIFPSLEDKKKFILKRRKDINIDNKRRYSVCVECWKRYPFGEENSTFFLCPYCEKKDLRKHKNEERSENIEAL